jgi:hypothetical protein
MHTRNLLPFFTLAALVAGVTVVMGSRTRPEPTTQHAQSVTSAERLASRFAALALRASTEETPVVVTLPQKFRRDDPRSASDLKRPERVSVGGDLQRELKRVGCYDGELNGLWNTAAQQGMEEFLREANAKLPSKKPDEVLLALVRGHSGKVCGAPCRIGEDRTKGGRCAPKLVTSSVATTAYRATAPSLTDERMALAGPKEALPDPVGVTGRPKPYVPEASQHTRKSWVADLWKRQAF